MSIQSLPTEYGGISFRSRTEARWALFFDLIDEPYIYEPEGFRLPSGEWYLPDFWLCNCEAWVEVKGHRHKQSDFFEKLMKVCYGGNDFPDAWGMILYGVPTLYNGTFVGSECTDSSGGTVCFDNNAFFSNGGKHHNLMVAVERYREAEFYTADMTKRLDDVYPVFNPVKNHVTQQIRYAAENACKYNFLK